MVARRLIAVEAWPPRMNAETAASYVGEKHVEDFLRRVGKDYPQPKWVETTKRRFWSRLDLDRAMGLIEAPSGMGARFRESRQRAG